MSQLLFHLNVFPELFKYLRAFGQKGYARDEGFSGCDVSVVRNVDGGPTGIGIS